MALAAAALAGATSSMAAPGANAPIVTLVRTIPLPDHVVEVQRMDTPTGKVPIGEPSLHQIYAAHA